MALTSDRAIARVLTATRTIALVGISARIERPSHRVCRFLLQSGYQVFPVNPGLAGQSLLGCPVFSRLSDIPSPIDMVDVFRQPKYLPGIVRETVDIGASTLWTQLGVVDLQAASSAERAGLNVVMDRCPAIELPRLIAAGLVEQRAAVGRPEPGN